MVKLYTNYRLSCYLPCEYMHGCIGNVKFVEMYKVCLDYMVFLLTAGNIAATLGSEQEGTYM